MTPFVLLLLLAHPNPQVTPGQVRALSTEVICTTKWGLDVRHVSTAKKRKVLALYGYTWAQRGPFVIDHLVPRELGGADEIANLWPQPTSESKIKDVDERRLHREVCAGTLDLAEAQRIMQQWGQPKEPQ